MQSRQIQTQLLEGCRRLAHKGFFRTPGDSFSMRIPGQAEMMLIFGQPDWGQTDWLQVELNDIRAVSFSSRDISSELHGWIYQARADVGAVVISSPRGVRLLAADGTPLPPIFDEQVRHLGSAGAVLKGEERVTQERVRKAFCHGVNAALLGERLVCLGMTCDRVLFNTELYEKCAQAYVIAKACDGRPRLIPRLVRLIANRRLLKDERRAAVSYRSGRIPEGVNSY